MDKNFLPQDRAGKLSQIAEEAAEIVQAVCKAQRFGIENHHPKTQETNLNAILREYGDLKIAIKRYIEDLQKDD